MRVTVGRLREMIAPSDVDLLGIVQVAESGVLRVYDVGRDGLEALV